MPSGGGRWAELSSQNERIVRPGDPDASLAPFPDRWAELASSGERLVDVADAQLRVVPDRGATPMRLVTGAA